MLLFLCSFALIGGVQRRRQRRKLWDLKTLDNPLVVCHQSTIGLLLVCYHSTSLLLVCHQIVALQYDNLAIQLKISNYCLSVVNLKRHILC